LLSWDFSGKKSLEALFAVFRGGLLVFLSEGPRKGGGTGESTVQSDLCQAELGVEHLEDSPRQTVPEDELVEGFSGDRGKDAVEMVGGEGCHSSYGLQVQRIPQVSFDVIHGPVDPLNVVFHAFPWVLSRPLAFTEVNWEKTSQPKSV
jgi:hypothetical protein